MASKEYLEKIIYQIHEASSFKAQSKLWSYPIAGFSYNQSRSVKFMNALMKKGIIQEPRENVIAILGEWENVAEGIFFTDKAIYVNSPKNSFIKFTVQYDEIKEMVYDANSICLTIITYDNRSLDIDTPMWSKRNIKLFLEIATGSMRFDSEDERRLQHVDINSSNINSRASSSMENIELPGVVFGNVSHASTMYGEDKFNTPRGHGFAAERANHLVDKLSGKKATIEGDNNVKNGMDRLVDGVQIQTKYCKSGSKCVQECFEGGSFKYMKADGTPMQIEVPSDKYDAAVQAMENRIKSGEVKGVTDPNEAKNIIRKGHFTYEQAKNIAKFGTVESIAYDAVNGAIVSTYSFGISFALTFAVSIWNGEDFKDALKVATHSGLKVGGLTFVTAVLSSQLSKAGLNSLLVGSSEAVVKMMGPKAAAMLANAFRSGANIYGAAAMKSAAKLLRSNAITAGISFVVLSSVDVVNIFRGRISGAQLFKNLTTTAASIGGGTAGWAGGATAGAAIGSVIPGVGTAIGGVVGGLIGAFAGGSIANKASSTVMDLFIEDDANQMVEIIEDVFKQLCEDYLVNEAEATSIVNALQSQLNGAKLKDMYASSNHKNFAKDLLKPKFEHIASNREPIELPTDIETVNALRELLEEIADEQDAIKK